MTAEFTFGCPWCAHRFLAGTFAAHIRNCGSRTELTDEERIAAYAKSVADDLEMGGEMGPYEKRIRKENDRRFGKKE